MNEFQDKYDKLNDSLKASNVKLKGLRSLLENKKLELEEKKKIVSDKEKELHDDKKIRDNMIESRIRKLDIMTFVSAFYSFVLVIMAIYFCVFKPFIIDGFLHKITNEILSGLALVMVSVVSPVPFIAIFFGVITLFISIENVIKSRMISRIKKSMAYSKQNEKVLARERELKDARCNKSAIKTEYDDLSLNISYEENVCKELLDEMENLRNEIVGTVIIDSNVSNVKHNNKTRVRSKNEEKI